MGRVKDITGRRFGKWTVLSFVGKRDGKGASRWRCRCSCGVEQDVVTGSLNNGSSTCCRACGYGHTNEEWSQQAAQRMINVYRKCARDRGYEWRLSDEQAIHLMSLPCTFCGEPPKNVCANRRGKYARGEWKYQGIDRVDNSIGYTHDNTVPCCIYCNRSKSDRSMDDFKAWIKKVSERMAA